MGERSLLLEAGCDREVYPGAPKPREASNQCRGCSLFIAPSFLDGAITLRKIFGQTDLGQIFKEYLAFSTKMDNNIWLCPTYLQCSYRAKNYRRINTLAQRS